MLNSQDIENNIYLKKYKNHLVKSIKWLKNSEVETGGSSAYYAPILGWSKAYPETTGYIIPTLLNYYNFSKDIESYSLAIRFGEWLLSIQNERGSWSSGTYPSKINKPSLFNTGQALRGILAISKISNDIKWKESCLSGIDWLISKMNNDCLWDYIDYLSNTTPSYYTYLFWPMLEISERFNLTANTTKIKLGLSNLSKRINNNGTISNWGFFDNKPAYTHTIGYTLKGFQECGLILNNDNLIKNVEPTLLKLMHLSEINGGILSGMYDAKWEKYNSFTCLTGNLQIAKCFLLQYKYDKDIRFLNASARLIDNVCSIQNIKTNNIGLLGAIPGSKPFWGRYMRFRYPNWAVKYFCDAILCLIESYSILRNE